VIQWALRTTGAVEFANRQIGELSYGERQRVMVARALAQEPQLMILDEITAFLDLPRRVEIMQMLRELARTTNKAILLSTHDLDLALRSADRIWLMPKNGALKIGAPEELALSGAFETAFAGEGVSFDQQTGSFHIAQAEAGVINVIGEGKEAFWTRRALERKGFRIDNDAPLQIKVVAENDQTNWRLTCSGTQREFGSLDSLLSAVES
jgi:iron complex transport system ATP-binding protein